MAIKAKASSGGIASTKNTPDCTGTNTRTQHQEHCATHDNPATNSELDASQLQRLSHVRELVFSSVQKQLDAGSLSVDIANAILLQYIQEEQDISDLTAWISTRTRMTIETHIGDLWQFAYRYAVVLTKDPDLAEEIAQSSITALVHNYRKVDSCRGWLRGTVYNQAMAMIKAGGKDRRLQKDLWDKEKQDQHLVIADDTDPESKLSLSEVRKILKKDEYALFKAIISARNLKEFAQQRGISHSKARELKRRIFINLKSGYLKRQGWTDTPVVLDYRSLVNIKRFLAALQNHVRQGSFARMFHYAGKRMLPKLEECFKDFRDISDWGIHLNPDNTMNLYVVSISHDQPPIPVQLRIKLNKANYIRIINCRVLELMGVVSEEKIGPLPTEKGRCTLTVEEIQAYLN